MTGAFARAWHGLAATLGVQLWLALSAAVPAALVGPLVERGPLRVDEPQAWLEPLARSPELALALAAPFAGSLLWHLLTLPAVQVAWLRALDRGSPRGSLRFGVERYVPAVRQSLTIAVVTASGAVALAGLPAFAAEHLSHRPESEGLALLALSGLPLAAWLLVCGAWHDLSRGQLAVHGASGLRDVLGLWTAAWHPACLAGYTLQLGVTLALATGAVAALGQPGLTGLLVAQGVLLARGFARSVWLAHVTRLAEPFGPR